jgi:hypothetical protein
MPIVVVEENDETTADVPTTSTETPLYQDSNDTNADADETPGPGANKRRIQTGQDNSNNNNNMSAGLKSLLSVGGVALVGWTVAVVYQQIIIQNVALVSQSIV